MNKYLNILLKTFSDDNYTTENIKKELLLINNKSELINFINIITVLKNSDDLINFIINIYNKNN